MLNATLEQIAATATSVRWHASEPSSYAEAVASALGIAALAPGTFTVDGDTVSCGEIFGTLITPGVAASLSVCDDVNSVLLVTMPLPVTTVMAATNYSQEYIFITQPQLLGSPTLTVNP
ncbi:MAG: hypothetical protein ACLP19_05830 [Xanthobacteraceae bacterium]